MTPFEKWSVWLTSTMVFITGTVYLVMKYLLPAPDGFSIIHHPLQSLFLKLHILSAPLLVFSVGAIAVRHAWRHFTYGTRDGRISGVGSGVLIVVMTVTGYLIQAVTGESSLKAIVVTHVVTGLGFGVVLLVHQIVVRRKNGGGY